MYIYNFTRNPPIPYIYPTFQPLNRQLTFHHVDQMANMVGPMTVWNRQSIPSGRNSFEASYPGKMENTIIPYHSKMCSPNSFHSGGPSKKIFFTKKKTCNYPIMIYCFHYIILIISTIISIYSNKHCHHQMDQLWNTWMSDWLHCGHCCGLHRFNMFQSCTYIGTFKGLTLW